MAVEFERTAWIQDQLQPANVYLQKFRLYETQSNFYVVGRDKSRTMWRVLKLDRQDPYGLNIIEDPTTYSEPECCDLLRRIHEGNRSTGGLKFVTVCYGIVGFVKFLGPYYMLLITKRRKIGSICGHLVYSVAKSEMIPIPNSSVRSNMQVSKNENRYKKLLCLVDLTKDFFFSYSYHIMHSLQKNICDIEAGQFIYEKMFVWNEFLTREIRDQLKGTDCAWTVPLVYGFFKQVKLSILDRNFMFTLVARRSRHYAGTRYLKRGVNEKGRVANDVETEQIVYEDAPNGCPVQISSVVQNRGSIPLFWSQETSKLKVKPDIILWRKDLNYEATKLHFENLVRRYGNPIIILNLIKTREKKPRESILRAEFANAIEFINKDLSKENRLRFLHWDLNKYSRTKGTSVLVLLSRVASYALNLTGIFHCQMVKTSWPNTSLNGCDTDKKDGSCEIEEDNSVKVAATGNYWKPQSFQNGILRANCIDCLDRTNVAQYAYGLVALGQQLHALGLVDIASIDLDATLADDLMKVFERMGDTLALQYGGSAAHNKIFCERRGQWKAATQSQEFFRTLQRYYSNAYMDSEKQDAINVFLGHFQPQEGRPALWELDSDQHCFVGCRSPYFTEENSKSMFKRSLSDGNIVPDNNDSTPVMNIKQELNEDKRSRDGRDDDHKAMSESTPEISTCESVLSNSRYTPSMSRRQLFPDLQEQNVEISNFCVNERRESVDFSNFLDVEWLSSSGNSCEEEAYERSTLINTTALATSSNNVLSGLKSESTAGSSEAGSGLKIGGEHFQAEIALSSPLPGDTPSEFSDNFVRWVTYGDSLFH
uniref:SAC domain-containing protein n=1 Tax=Kalanchoe fedtschenkoi TaxID=63787 RepID=A0A7N0RGD1_KALFE